MILLVEAGNSAIKWAWHKAVDPDHVSRAWYRDYPDHDALFMQAWSGLDLPNRVVVANVGGDALQSALDGWVMEHWQLEAEYIAAQASAFGVVNAYPEPRRLGADRWAALVAARHQFAGNVCIVDAGTAITIDTLDAEGRHLGGLIIPGIRMMQQALAGFTHMDAEIGNVLYQPELLLAKDTESAIAAGSFNTAIAVIDRTVQAIVTELSGNVHCILTGGDADKIAGHLQAHYDLAATLVLTGIAVIAEGTQPGETPGTIAP
jgi:type III pantothenate kinase